MRINFRFNRVARLGGGLTLGITYSFPVHVWEPEGAFDIPTHFLQRTIVLGLIFWRLVINVETGHYQSPIV